MQGRGDDKGDDVMGSVVIVPEKKTTFKRISGSLCSNKLLSFTNKTLLISGCLSWFILCLSRTRRKWGRGGYQCRIHLCQFMFLFLWLWTILHIHSVYIWPVFVVPLTLSLDKITVFLEGERRGSVSIGRRKMEGRHWGPLVTGEG